MRKTTVTVALVAAIVLAAGSTSAQEKEQTLEGKVTCAKCELKLKDAKGCQTVLVVKDGDKQVIYYFDAESHKKYHKEICEEGKEGTVVGTVTEKGKKKYIHVSKVEFK